jgi:hypothetical protein
VAKLLRHRSTDMVMSHYQHLRDRQKHMRQAAVQATREGRLDSASRSRMTASMRKASARRGHPRLQ